MVGNRRKILIFLNTEKSCCLSFCEEFCCFSTWIVACLNLSLTAVIFSFFLQWLLLSKLASTLFACSKMQLKGLTVAALSIEENFMLETLKTFIYLGLSFSSLTFIAELLPFFLYFRSIFIKNSKLFVQLTHFFMEQ